MASRVFTYQINPNEKIDVVYEAREYPSCCGGHIYHNFNIKYAEKITEKTKDKRPWEPIGSYRYSGLTKKTWKNRVKDKTDFYNKMYTHMKIKLKLRMFLTAVDNTHKDHYDNPTYSLYNLAKGLKFKADPKWNNPNSSNHVVSFHRQTTRSL